MERLGIIDLGSNSVRLVIINIDDNGAHHQIENLKETVRLIGGTDRNGMLSEASMRYAIDTVKIFAKFCKARRVDTIKAVATAAVRRAANRDELVARIKDETGIEFRVLSGDEEAHLGYVGVVNTMNCPTGLMADLGGGSLKLVSFQDRLQTSTASQGFGAVTLSKGFDLHDRPSPENLAKLENFLIDSYGTLPWLRGFEPIIGLGGTFRSLARLARRRFQYVPDITDGMELSLQEVKEIYDAVSSATLEERRTMPGMEWARADLIVAGVAAIYFLMKVSGRERLIVSTSSIRDGLLFEYLHRHTGDPIVLSVLTHHIDNLINYYRLEEDHLRRVSNLAVTLFDQLQTVHNMGSFERRVLLVASLLHEIGVVISVEGRDKHTLYMLLNSRLQGFSHRERVIAAYLAASHDELFLSNIELYIKQGPLFESDVSLIEKLAALLQITHSLDRCHTGVVTQVRTTVEDSACAMQVMAKSGAELEIHDAQRRSRSFAKAFGRELRITLA